MARPPGAFRTALFGAAQQLREERGHFNAYDLACASQVQATAAARTAENMARAGVFVIVGKEKRADQRGWVNLYELPDPEEAAEPPDHPEPTTEPLAAVMASWLDFE
jgi:hypothetical protein